MGMDGIEAVGEYGDRRSICIEASLVARCIDAKSQPARDHESSGGKFARKLSRRRFAFRRSASCADNRDAHRIRWQSAQNVDPEWGIGNFAQDGWIFIVAE